MFYGKPTACRREFIYSILPEKLKTLQSKNPAEFERIMHGFERNLEVRDIAIGPGNCVDACFAGLQELEETNLNSFNMISSVVGRMVHSAFPLPEPRRRVILGKPRLVKLDKQGLVRLLNHRSMDL